MEPLNFELTELEQPELESLDFPALEDFPPVDLDKLDFGEPLEQVELEPLKLDFPELELEEL